MRYNGVGFNLRMTEWQAAIGYLQMKRLPEILELRAAAARALKRLVSPLVTSDYSNWYKFIAPADFPAKRVTGQVYAASDQLTPSMSLAGEYPNAAWVADQSHMPADRRGALRRHERRRNSKPIWRGEMQVRTCERQRR